MTAGGPFLLAATRDRAWYTNGMKDPRRCSPMPRGGGQCRVGGHMWESEITPTRRRRLCRPTPSSGRRGRPGYCGR